MRRMSELFHEVPHRLLAGSMCCRVLQLTADSRQVVPGAVFVAVRGTQTDGHGFLEAALDRGAAALVVESLTPRLLQRVQAEGQTVVQVQRTARALGMMASAFHEHPSRSLRLVGITGTNGKTTTTYIVEAMLRAAGKAVGVIGTVNYRYAGKQVAAPQTTPGAPEVQALLRDMVEAGVGDAVMEVSSHALDQERVRGCAFAVSVFTNLSRDHYDYHGTEEAYFASKMRLFRELPAQWHVLNLDDPFGRRLVHTTRARLLTYGLTSEATLKPSEVEHSLDGIRFALPTTKGRLTVRSPLVGRHNVYNLLAGIGIALALDVEAGAIVEGIAGLHDVPGRLERVDCGQDFHVFVDYAHTPDALEQILRAVRAETRGRLITVFGCGGDRDPGKRPLMGRVATMLSDDTIITSDNPRTEDAQAIIDAIVAGVDTRRPYVTMVERREAIFEAISRARRHDTVLIAGKGHEDYQILGTQRLPFDDREVARQALRTRL